MSAGRRRVCASGVASSPTWSLRSRLWNPGTALANSVSSVTVSTEVLWQQWKSLASASLCRSSPHPRAGTISPMWRLFSDPPWCSHATCAASVFSASWNVSMLWMINGCWEQEEDKVLVA